MRIVSWNCQGEYRNKIDKLLQLKPDIAIIQECENLEKLHPTCGNKLPEQRFWFGGDYPHKGLGVFFHQNYDIELMESDNNIEFIIPIKVKAEHEFILFAIWAMWNEDKSKAFTGQIVEAINNYYELLKENNSILIGDYNSPNIEKSTVVEQFKELGYSSAYHRYYKENFGENTQFTWYNHRKDEFKHILDYCFLPESLINKIENLEIGSYNDWIDSRRLFTQLCHHKLKFEGQWNPVFIH